MSRKRFFALAKNIACQSEFKTFKHGAVLVRGGSVINVAHNQCVHSKLAERFKKHNGWATRHSEINVILGVNRKVTTGADVYVVRVNNTGELKNSRPCNMCIDTMKFVGIGRVFYSISDNEYGVIRLL